MYAERLNARAAFIKLEEVLRTDDGSLPPEEFHKARRKLVDMAILMRRPLDAETHIALLMKETPDDPELLDLNGQILIYNGKDEEACKQFRRAIEIAPTQINSYFRLAFVLRSRLDKKAEADEVMHDMIHRKLKDKDGKVIKDKDGKAVEVNAKSVAAFQKYAYWLREQERFDEALVQANRVLELAPENPVGLWIAGCCYLAKGQYKTAEDYLNRGIKADKSDRAMYKVMADVKNHLGRHKEAMEVLRKWGWKTPRGPPATRTFSGTWSIRTSLTASSTRPKRASRNCGSSARAGHALSAATDRIPRGTPGGDERRLERRQDNPRRRPAQAAG